MNDPTSLGMNKTGMDMAKMRSKSMLENTNARPTSQGGLLEIQNIRMSYGRDAEPIGTVPIPGTLKGLAKTTLKKLTGNRPEVLVDKLAERMTFERSGVRLYELMLTKCESRPDEVPSGLKDILQKTRDEEEQHFGYVHAVISTLGADPTAMTPGADAVGVASAGLIQVLADPRTSVAEGLHALLMAELVDNAGWDLLIRLMEEAGIEEGLDNFQKALDDETRHLTDIRSWYERMVVGQETKERPSDTTATEVPPLA